MKKTFLSILIIFSFFGIFSFLGTITKVEAGDNWYFLVYIRPTVNGQKSPLFSSLEECNIKRTELINSEAFQIGFKPDGTGAYTSYPSECIKETTTDPVMVTGQEDDFTMDDTYTLLAPIGEFKEAPKNIGDYFNTIFKIVIGLCGALAVVMIVIGGVQYMGDESIFGKTEAKSKITSAIFGLIIALGSYALLNTINPDLLGGKGVKINSVSAEIDPEVHGDIPQSSAVNGKYCNGRVVDGAEIDTVTNRRWDQDQTERNLLLEKGIKIQRQTSCHKVGEKNCTSLTGLDTSKVIAFKNKCTTCGDNDVFINGATECWNHSQETQHYPGNSIVDIDDTQIVDAYIKTGIKTRDSKNTYDIYEKDGMRFLDEGNHYHVLSW